MSREGLQKTKVKGIDLAYARPGASLAAYKRVMIDPVDVQFDPSWDPVRTGSLIKLSSEEREKIRTGVARIVHDEFVKALQAKSTYQIATEPGPDVLRVKASIVNLYVNAPDSAGAGRSRHLGVLRRPDDAAERVVRRRQRPVAGTRRRPARGRQ